MQTCFLLIPLFSAILGWLSIIIVLEILFRYLLPSRWPAIQNMIVKQLQEKVTPGLLSAKLQELDLEKEVSPLLDLRLNRLIEQLKKQVPMGEYFLSGALVEQLKARAKEEILQTMPEMKVRLLEKAEKEFDLNKLIEDQVQGISYSQFASSVKQQFKRDIFKIKALGALIGFILGILDSVLSFLFGGI